MTPKEIPFEMAFYDDATCVEKKFTSSDLQLLLDRDNADREKYRLVIIIVICLLTTLEWGSIGKERPVYIFVLYIYLNLYFIFITYLFSLILFCFWNFLLPYVSVGHFTHCTCMAAEISKFPGVLWVYSSILCSYISLVSSLLNMVCNVVFLVCKLFSIQQFVCPCKCAKGIVWKWLI